MIREILKYPDPILRKRCEEVEEITEEIKQIAQDMVETNRKNGGIGLATCQTGVLKRIIVVETKDGPRVFINPEILNKTKEKNIAEEGCLSFPGLFLKIKRCRGVEIAALNEKGEKKQYKTEGLAARIFQHEIDHLNGILFIDRLNFFQKLLFRIRLNRPKQATKQATKQAKIWH